MKSTSEVRTATGWYCTDCGFATDEGRALETCPHCFGTHWSVRPWRAPRPADPFAAEAPPTRAGETGSLARLPR